MPPKKVKKQLRNSKAIAINNLLSLSAPQNNGGDDISPDKSTPIEEKSMGEQDWKYDNQDVEELEISELEYKTNVMGLSRTDLLILDYLHFKAARVIQRFGRGWLCRIRYQRKRNSAIIIQTEWRRYYYQRLYYRKLEAILQQRIEQHFYLSAQIIQSFWRGWWVRHHIHGHTHLLSMQLTAGKELLHCVAFKLHHLLRTHHIPGVYSLRNSTALSKVEQLLSTLTFKTCNARTRQAKKLRQNEIDEARKTHKKSAFGTEIPFCGPNINNICTPKCMTLYNGKNVDRRMAKILQTYEEANRESAQANKLKKTLNSIPALKNYVTKIN